jgi:hypothetical protein
MPSGLRPRLLIAIVRCIALRPISGADADLLIREQYRLRSHSHESNRNEMRQTDFHLLQITNIQENSESEVHGPFLRLEEDSNGRRISHARNDDYQKRSSLRSNSTGTSRRAYFSTKRADFNSPGGWTKELILRDPAGNLAQSWADDPDGDLIEVVNSRVTVDQAADQFHRNHHATMRSAGFMVVATLLRS